MPLTYDPEFWAAFAPLAEAYAKIPKFPAGDVASRRAAFAQQRAVFRAQTPVFPDVTRVDHQISVPGAAGPSSTTIASSNSAPDAAPAPATATTTILLAEFRKNTGSTLHPPPAKAIYFVHGGGMIVGNVDAFAASCARRVSDLGLPLFAIEYRLAPEFPHPVPLQDAWAGLQWVYEHAQALGVDREKVVVLGDSAGGGIAAGLTLLARDQALHPPILKQILIYPMLDDRNNQPDAALEPLAAWRNADNITGWTALLGASAGDPTAPISPYAAPARAADAALVGLPPTYIEVGQLDIFAYEDVEFARRLMRAGVPTELHVYPGMPHGFQGLSMEAKITRGSVANVRRAILDA